MKAKMANEVAKKWSQELTRKEFHIKTSFSITPDNFRDKPTIMERIKHVGRICRLPLAFANPRFRYAFFNVPGYPKELWDSLWDVGNRKAWRQIYDKMAQDIVVAEDAIILEKLKEINNV